MCVCVIYNIYRVCEVKIFLPLKKGTIERKTQTRVRFTLSLSPSLFLSGLFRSRSCPNLSTFLSGSKKKEEKKIESNFFSKKRGFFQESHHFLFLRYYYYVELFSLSARILKERVGEKGEDKRV